MGTLAGQAASPGVPVTSTVLLASASLAGVLSAVLGVFAHSGANILTINQSVPTNGCAVVTISAETMDLTVQLEELLHDLRLCSGIIKAEVLAG